MKRRTISVSLNERELEALSELSDRTGMSKSALIRQAIRLYQSVNIRIDAGEKMYFEKPGSREKLEVVVL